jgi:poly(A)-specific ribonuclease
LITRGSQADHDQETSKKMFQDLEHEIGFRKIIDALIESKKPIVVHNGILDLCHIYAKFIDRLPMEVSVFKTQFTALFPSVYDTKYLAILPGVSEKINNTHLCDLYESVRQSSFFNKIKISISTEDTQFFNFINYLQDGGNFHDAGYDAFCTGYIFSHLMQFICDEETSLKDQANKFPEAENTTQSTENSSSLEWLSVIKTHEARNKMNMMRSDIPYFRLSGVEQDFPDRSRLFYISGRIFQSSTMDTLFPGSIVGNFRYHLVEDNNAVFLDFKHQTGSSESKPIELVQKALVDICSTNNLSVESYSEYSLRVTNQASEKQVL